MFGWLDGPKCGVGDALTRRIEALIDFDRSPSVHLTRAPENAITTRDCTERKAEPDVADLHKRQKPRNLRLRLDVYEPSTRQYRPLAGRSVIIPVETTRLFRPLWRGILAYLESHKWREEIRPEDVEPIPRPGEGPRRV